MSYSIERAYQQIIDACDQVPPEQRELLLAKLALVCAEQIGDDARFAACLQIALRDLTVKPAEPAGHTASAAVIK